jgi:hypothetical protein
MRLDEARSKKKIDFKYNDFHCNIKNQFCLDKFFGVVKVFKTLFKERFN